MNVVIVILVLVALGLLGIVTKSIIGIILGAIGIALSFLLFCTGALLGLLGKIVAIVFSLAIIGAAIIFVPVALFVIIPGIYFAYLFAKKKGYCRSAGEVLKRKAIV
jgi:hypothetical protein